LQRKAVFPHAPPEALGILTGALQEVGVVYDEERLGWRENDREAPRALVEGRPWL